MLNDKPGEKRRSGAPSSPPVQAPESPGRATKKANVEPEQSEQPDEEAQQQPAEPPAQDEEESAPQSRSAALGEIIGPEHALKGQLGALQRSESAFASYESGLKSGIREASNARASHERFVIDTKNKSKELKQRNELITRASSPPLF